MTDGESPSVGVGGMEPLAEGLRPDEDGALKLDTGVPGASTSGVAPGLWGVAGTRGEAGDRGDRRRAGDAAAGEAGAAAPGEARRRFAGEAALACERRADRRGAGEAAALPGVAGGDRRRGDRRGAGDPATRGGGEDGGGWSSSSAMAYVWFLLAYLLGYVRCSASVPAVCLRCAIRPRSTTGHRKGT